MGVTKNIIPAVASTNALVSAACVNETIKLLTGCAPSVENYMQYGGQSNVSCSDLAMERNPGCFVCSREVLEVSVESNLKIKDWLGGTVDEEGQEVLKGLCKQYMLNHPTTVS